MVYEFLVGKRLDDYNVDQKYSNKWSTDIPITTLTDVVKSLNKELHAAFADINAPLDVSDILSEFAKLEKDITSDKEQESKELTFTRIRELLSLLSFYEFEVYLFERPDLKSESDSESPNRCYLIDEHDRFFPELNRLASAYCIQFDAPENMSVPDMVFSIIGRSVRFSTFTTQLLHLEEAADNYEKLVKVSGQWRMDVSKVLRFLNDYGYTLIGVQG